MSKTNPSVFRDLLRTVFPSCPSLEAQVVSDTQLVGAHAWVAGYIPDGDGRSLVFLSLSPSLSKNVIKT